MNGWLRSLSYIFLFLLLAIPPGCSDDDGGTDPGGIQTGDPVTQATIDQGLVMSDALVELMPQWSSGNLVGPPTKDAIYNPNCQCWTWEVTQGDGFSNPYDYTIWGFQAIFYTGESIVQNPQEADRVQVVVNYSWNKGTYPDDNKKDDESTSFNATLTMTLSPLGGNPVTVSGSGIADYLSTGTRNGNFFEYYGNFTVAMNLSLPLAGCPSGTMTLEEGQTLFSISYDGSSTANWTLSQGDQGNPVQGTRTLGCGND